jgi:hypothetical protein
MANADDMQVDDNASDDSAAEKGYRLKYPPPVLPILVEYRAIHNLAKKMDFDDEAEMQQLMRSIRDSTVAEKIAEVLKRRRAAAIASVAPRASGTDDDEDAPTDEDIAAVH